MTEDDSYSESMTHTLRALTLNKLTNSHRTINTTMHFIIQKIKDFNLFYSEHKTRVHFIFVIKRLTPVNLFVYFFIVFEAVQCLKCQIGGQ